MSFLKEAVMARRKIKRKRGEGISISGPATVHVSRCVTLVIDAPGEAHIARLRRGREQIDEPPAGRLATVQKRVDRG